MIGVIGIVLSLALLMYLAYRGINVLFLAPICATIAVVFAGLDSPVLGTYTQVFMVELGKYLAKFFPLFMLGAIFGKLMDDSGSASVIAQWIADKVGAERALLAIVLACGLLTYGGVSLFVVAFAVYPIGAALLRTSDTPKRLLPGAIALGSFTFTMTALPYTPSIQNAIPSPFFGTNTGAAPGLGIIGGLLMFIIGMVWLTRRAHAAKARGEGYGIHDEPPATAAAAERRPPFIVALAPIIVVIVLNFVFTNYILPAMDTAFLAQPRYGATKLSAVLGIWSIIIALIAACLTCVAVNWSRFGNLTDTINKGTFGSMLPIFNTASEVGYGSVIASLPAFALVRDAMTAVTTCLGNLRCRQCSRRHHRIGVWRNVDRIDRRGRSIAAGSARGRDQRSDPAPRRGDVFGRLRFIAAQRRGDHAPRDLRPYAQAELRRHLHLQRGRTGGGYCGRHPAQPGRWHVLRATLAAEAYDAGNSISSRDGRPRRIRSLACHCRKGGRFCPKVPGATDLAACR